MEYNGNMCGHEILDIYTLLSIGFKLFVGQISQDFNHSDYVMIFTMSAEVDVILVDLKQEILQNV